MGTPTPLMTVLLMVDSLAYMPCGVQQQSSIGTHILSIGMTVLGLLVTSHLMLRAVVW